MTCPFAEDMNAHKDRRTNHRVHKYLPLDVGTGRPLTRGADEHAFEEERVSGRCLRGKTGVYQGSAVGLGQASAGEPREHGETDGL